MNYFNRALASMKRRPGKTVILLLLVLVLGTVISGAVSIRQAVLNTDANLRAQLPAVATLQQDQEAINRAWNNGEEVEWVPMTADTIRQVGNLPYVETFNMSIQTQLFGTLERYWNPIQEEGSDWVEEDWNDRISQGADFNSFTLRGIYVPDLFEIESGLMELSSGSLFTEAQIQNGDMVAIIAQPFAEQNNLSVGSTIVLSRKVLDQAMGMGNNWMDMFTEEAILAEEEVELEVVGILAVVGEFEGETWMANQTKQEVENRITVPLPVVENSIRQQIALEFEYQDPDFIWRDPDADPEDDFWFESLFLLEDPAYLPAFAQAADEILTGFWAVTDLSNTFGDIAGSMETMLMIANIVLGVSIGATLVILSLLITLFLRDRKYEIGIYLALGEKRTKVVGQILIEVMSTAVVAVGLALFAGSLISSGISQQMLQNDLQQRQEERWNQGMSWSSSDMELAMFSPGEMSIEQMLEAYDTSLDGATVAIFFGVAIGTVLISTLAPMLYVMQFNPKKIMM